MDVCGAHDLRQSASSKQLFLDFDNEIKCGFDMISVSLVCISRFSMNSTKLAINF